MVCCLRYSLRSLTSMPLSYATIEQRFSTSNAFHACLWICQPKTLKYFFFLFPSIKWRKCSLMLHQRTHPFDWIAHQNLLWMALSLWHCTFSSCILITLQLKQFSPEFGEEKNKTMHLPQKHYGVVPLLLNCERFNYDVMWHCAHSIANIVHFIISSTFTEIVTKRTLGKWKHFSWWHFFMLSTNLN